MKLLLIPLPGMMQVPPDAQRASPARGQFRCVRNVGVQAWAVNHSAKEFVREMAHTIDMAGKRLRYRESIADYGPQGGARVQPERCFQRAGRIPATADEASP